MNTVLELLPGLEILFNQEPSIYQFFEDIWLPYFSYKSLSIDRTKYLSYYDYISLKAVNNFDDKEPLLLKSLSYVSFNTRLKDLLVINGYGPFMTWSNDRTYPCKRSLYTCRIRK